MNYWIWIINKKNWNIVNDKGVWGVTKHYTNIRSQVNIGDKLLFYIKGGKVKGIYEALSTMFEDKEIIFFPISLWNKDENFTYRIKIKRVSRDVVELNIYDILNNLAVTKIKKIGERVSSEQ